MVPSKGPARSQRVAGRQSDPLFGGGISGTHDESELGADAFDVPPVVLDQKVMESAQKDPVRDFF